MSKLETQYSNFITENPQSKWTFEEWKQNKFNTIGEKIPYVSNDFQIGPDGAYEHRDYKFKVGDKAYKPKGYKFPCTIVSVFETTSAQVRVVAEMDDYGLLHIFNEEQLELF